jgi:RimJ/RimL family protein N-acetyltransferase
MSQGFFTCRPEKLIMPGALFLEGERVELRTVEEEDLEFIRDYRNHPEMHSQLWQRKPMNMSGAEKRLEAAEERPSLIIWKEDERVGVIEFNSVNKNIGYGDIGYWVKPEQQGNEYVTEAAELLITHAFNEMNLNKITGNVPENNKPSQRVFEKLGFKKEGELRNEAYHEGKHRNLYHYGILKQEWRSE